MLTSAVPNSGWSPTNTVWVSPVLCSFLGEECRSVGSLRRLFRVLCDVGGLALLLVALSAPALAVVPPVPLGEPTPVYPEDQLHPAEVTVLVEVSSTGEVVKATAIKGPAAFHSAAEAAWAQVRFTPGTVHGEPAQTSVELVVYFEPPDLSIVVSEEKATEDTHSITTLSEEVMARSRGQDLAEAVATVPGVVAARGTADNSKPIIRGQVERRLLVLTDGVRLQSQKWGKDHASEIDTFSAGEISVIKGAAGVRYGADAIGGVVLITPKPMPKGPGVSGSAQATGALNGRRAAGAVRVDGVLKSLPEVAFRLTGDLSRGAALSAPDYVLGNTGGQLWNLGARVQVAVKHSTFTFSAHHYDLKAGICYCVRNSSTDDFLAQLQRERPVGASSWTPSYTIDRAYQAVTHDLIFVRSHTHVLGGTLNATYAFQLNHRREFSQAREDVVGAQFDFTLNAHSLDVDFAHRAADLGSLGSLTGELGTSLLLADNAYTGLPLIPNYRAMTGGLFVLERLGTPTLAVTVGARFDHEDRASYLTPSAFDRHLARGTLTNNDCEQSADAARCHRQFSAASLSSGVLWRPSPSYELKVDLSSANRAPSGDELYMNGSAPTSPVFALGDPSLAVERTTSASVTGGVRLPALRGELSVFSNRTKNYIYFSPELNNGAPAFDVTVRGAFPRFSFRPITALYYGVDGGLTLGPNAPVSLSSSGSLVRAQNLNTKDPLLFVPPPQLNTTFTVQPLGFGPFSKNFFSITGQYIAQQTDVIVEQDLAPPPEAAFLLGATVGVDRLLHNKNTLRVSVTVSNLLNTRYRDYTSLLRYYSDEPGRQVRLSLSTDF